MTLQAGTLALIQNDIVKVVFGGVNLGFTTDGIDLEYTPEMEDLLVDEFGASPMDIMSNGGNLSVTMRLSEYSTSLLVDLIPGSQRDVSGPDSRVTFGRSAGFRYRDFAKTLLLHPIKLADSDKSRDVLIELVSRKIILQHYFFMLLNSGKINTITGSTPSRVTNNF